MESHRNDVISAASVMQMIHGLSADIKTQEETF
jgi:hypothetical protein